ncbi:MAG: B12-binding domain-containing protein [Peptococcaceae bacterium]
MIIDKIKESIAKGDASACVEQIEQALLAGLPWVDILDNALVTATLEAGERFKRSEIYGPEMFISARAMHKGLQLLCKKACKYSNLI